ILEASGALDRRSKLRRGADHCFHDRVYFPTVLFIYLCYSGHLKTEENLTQTNNRTDKQSDRQTVGQITVIV
ncbi:MAG: hypothetical protein II940_04815, partial [Methanosarcinaceae archaeon]|nr:hypothetical protein [Methanosarcinaceae archaeon]